MKNSILIFLIVFYIFVLFIFKGYCHCKSQIEIQIDNESNDLTTLFECQITKSQASGECRKRQLRGPLRKVIGAELSEASVDVYQAEKRRELQQHGDPEPPTLYSDKVLRQAKHEFIVSQYLDRDPLKALQKLKRTPMGKNVIRHIGLEPFFIYIFSSHQIRLWNMFCTKVPLLVDSTTGVAQKISTFPEKSHTLELHVGVINCRFGQLAVFEGILERQDTVSIKNLFEVLEISNVHSERKIFAIFKLNRIWLLNYI